jgi:hypothetical protein
VYKGSGVNDGLSLAVRLVDPDGPDARTPTQRWTDEMVWRQNSRERIVVYLSPDGKKLGLVRRQDGRNPEYVLEMGPFVEDKDLVAEKAK